MTVTRFDGTSLPSGWTAIAPTGGHVDVSEGYLRLSSDAGVEFNSLTGSVTTPEGPQAVLPVSGSFDYAVGLGNAVNAAVHQSFELTAWNDTEQLGMRFAQYVSGISERNPSWFAYARTGEGNSNITMADPPSNLYGPRSWMRLRLEGDNWTFMSSQTGKPGTWFTHGTFNSGFIPQTFQLGMTAAQADSAGRELRFAVVVDMDGRSDDATTPPPAAVDRNTVWEVEAFDGSSLPSQLTSDVQAPGEVTVGGFAMHMYNTPDVESWAHVLLDSSIQLPRNHGVRLRYSFPSPTTANCFAAIIIRAANSTDLPSSKVLPDKYRPGTGLLVEINGNSSAGDVLRTLTAHPVDKDVTAYSGATEFYGFSMMQEDLNGPVDNSNGDFFAVRLEVYEGYWRVKYWPYNGPGSEPAAWNYEGEDWTQDGTTFALAWAHNDSTIGGGVTNQQEFAVDGIELYGLTAAASGGLQAYQLVSGSEVPIALSQLQGGAEVPVELDTA